MPLIDASLVWLGTAITAFLGAYLGEKAKNLALKEDIKRVVGDVELIKRSVEGQFWVEQERWRFRADHYGKLLENLGEQAVLYNFFANANAKDDKGGKDQVVTQLEQDWFTRQSQLWLDLANLQSIAGIWLAPEASVALEGLEDEQHLNVADSDYAASLGRSKESCLRALNALQEAARTDLELSRPGDRLKAPGE